MRVSCNSCEWVGEVASRDDVPDQCPECGGSEFTVGNEAVVPEQARGDEGAEATVHQVSVFPDEYTTSSNPSTTLDIDGEECLRSLVDMGVDFDRYRHAHIPTAIILPRPIWVCGVRLKYNPRCRPERNWTPDSVGDPPPDPERPEMPDSPDEPMPYSRTARRGRLVDANCALAIARFFRYMHDQLGVVQVDHAGIHPGRANPANPARNAAHGWGKAIDFCFFYIVQGDQHDSAGFYGPPAQGIEEGNICHDWGPLLQPPTTLKERFLRQMETELNVHFSHVLGPDHTARREGTGDHTTHFHVDVHHYTTR